MTGAAAAAGRLAIGGPRATGNAGGLAGTAGAPAGERQPWLSHSDWTCPRAACCRQPASNAASGADSPAASGAATLLLRAPAHTPSASGAASSGNPATHTHREMTLTARWPTALEPPRHLPPQQSARQAARRFANLFSILRRAADRNGQATPCDTRAQTAAAPTHGELTTRAAEQIRSNCRCSARPRAQRSLARWRSAARRNSKRCLRSAARL